MGAAIIGVSFDTQADNASWAKKNDFQFTLLSDEDHAIGHHIAGPKVSAPENCGTPQLLVATFVPPDFPAPPSFTVAVSHVEPVMVAPVRSIAPSFDTPPPRV